MGRKGYYPSAHLPRKVARNKQIDYERNYKCKEYAKKQTEGERLLSKCATTESKIDTASALRVAKSMTNYYLPPLETSKSIYHLYLKNKEREHARNYYLDYSNSLYDPHNIYYPAIIGLQFTTNMHLRIYNRFPKENRKWKTLPTRLLILSSRFATARFSFELTYYIGFKWIPTNLTNCLCTVAGRKIPKWVINFNTDYGMKNLTKIPIRYIVEK